MATAAATLGPSPLAPAVVRVRSRFTETHDTFTLTLDPPRADYRFGPGQFNMLYVFGVGEAAISLSGDPDAAECVHTIRAVGSVTNALARLGTGAAIGVRGPFGSTWPVEAARGKDVVLVTGGIGLAPLRPTIYHLLRHRQEYGRVVLIHGVRTPQDMLFADEIRAWSQRGDFQVLCTVEHADASWQGQVGLVTHLFAQAVFDPARTIAMMCGPEIMMRVTIREFARRGVAEEGLYLSLERNMHCAVGFCGHCQLGPSFVCMDGPVLRYDRMKPFLDVREA